jgi:hypothetical protein
MKRCQWCKHALLPNRDAPGDYVICALMPPSPVAVSTPQHGAPDLDLVGWHRPAMMLKARCGQFGFSVLRFFGHGPRA